MCFASGILLSITTISGIISDKSSCISDNNSINSKKVGIIIAQKHRDSASLHITYTSTCVQGAPTYVLSRIYWISLQSSNHLDSDLSFWKSPCNVMLTLNILTMKQPDQVTIKTTIFLKAIFYVRRSGGFDE